MAQRPDPTVERLVERMYSAMRTCIASAPLASTGSTIRLLAGDPDARED